jgi:hypothetical protein
MLVIFGLKEDNIIPNPVPMDGIIFGINKCPPRKEGCSFLGYVEEGKFNDLLQNGSSYEDVGELGDRALNHFLSFPRSRDCERILRYEIISIKFI